jgi:hypothetical protein
MVIFLPALLALAGATGARATPSKSLDKGAELLAEFRAEDAVILLEDAKTEGPYTRADYIRLFEQLGIAYAYLDRSKDALAAFDMLLALDPGRAISYTLSPKVTFLFEKARGAAADRAAPTIDLRWPLGKTVSEPIPLDVEVVADPRKFLKRAKIQHRMKGAPEYQTIELALPAGREPQRIDLPPGAPNSTKDEVVELYLVAYDQAGNEVHQWGTANRPREIAVRYEAPDPWYSKWWFWAIAGSVVAAGASAAVFAATREPGPTVGGELRVVE